MTSPTETTTTKVDVVGPVGPHIKPGTMPDCRGGKYYNPASWNFEERHFGHVMQWKLCKGPSPPPFPSAEEAKRKLPQQDPNLVLHKLLTGSNVTFGERLEHHPVLHGERSDNNHHSNKKESNQTKEEEGVTTTTTINTTKGFHVNNANVVNVRTGAVVTWIGHSTFLVQVNGINILTDPVWSERVSPVSFAGPARMHRVPMAIHELPQIHIVTISHNHYDHLDFDAVTQLQKTFRPLFVIPAGMDKWFLKNIKDAAIRPLNWWECIQFTEEELDPDLRLSVKPGAARGGDYVACATAIPAQHWSMRSGFDRYSELWSGFVVEVRTSAPLSVAAAQQTTTTTEVSDGDEKTTSTAPPSPTPTTLQHAWMKILHCGDTGYCPGYKEVGERFKSIDVSLIPIGAYEPRWMMRPQHVDPEEAVKIHQDVNSRFSLGMHWGTFILTDEPIDEPPKKLKEEMDKIAIEGGGAINDGVQHPFRVIPVGASIFYPGPLTSDVMGDPTTVTTEQKRDEVVVEAARHDATTTTTRPTAVVGQSHI